MKKIFIVFGMAAFSSASAQNDLFDIPKHLQKKQAAAKKSLQKESFIYSLRYNNPYISAVPRLSYSLSNGNKVYLLPQDNMPCIVPDMSQFNMYNAAKTPQNSTVSTPFSRNMPNAVTPYTIIPPEIRKQNFSF